MHLFSKIRRKLLGGKIRNIYKTYHEALYHCKENSYHTTKLAEYIARKTSLFRDRDLQSLAFTETQLIRMLTLIAMIRNKCRCRVLDFGGGAGYHYLLAKKLAGDVLFDWHIVETEPMTEVGKQYLSEIQFHTSTKNACQATGIDRFDVVFACGSVQYTEKPFQTISELLSLKAGLYYISKVAVSESSEGFIVQKSRMSDNGPGKLEIIPDPEIEYPMGFLSINEIKNIFLKMNKRLMYEIYEENHSNDGLVTPLMGYLLEDVR